MALSREDFLNATPDNPPTMPEGVFGPPAERGPEWPDSPDLRAAVDPEAVGRKTFPNVKRAGYAAFSLGTPPSDQLSGFTAGK